MRINNVDKLMKVYKSEVKNLKESKQATKRDKIEISSQARDYQFALGKFRELPELRTEKIEEIREKIQSGSYRVDSEKIADKILARSEVIKKYGEW